VLLFSTIGPQSFAYGNGSWVSLALKLSAESESVYLASLKKLKAFPHLDVELASALKENSTRTFLALDVISTLKLEPLAPEVLASAQTDQSGFFYLCLNTFFKTHSAEFFKLYLARLQDPATRPPVKMVVLDTLGRLKVRIDEKELQKLLDEKEVPEVRSAALYYLRTFALLKHHDYDATLKWVREMKSTRTGPFVAQLNSLLSELNDSKGRL